MKQSAILLIVFLVMLNNEGWTQNNQTTDILATQYNPADRMATRDSLKAARKEKENGVSGNRKKADRLYKDLGYKASVDLYHELSESEKNSEQVLARMANSYRLNNNTEEAEYWYAKFVHQTEEAKHLLYFAQVLQSNDKCEDAVRWFNKYEEKAGKAARKHRGFIRDCDQLASFDENEAIEIRNVEELNSAHLDFSPIPYKDGFVFTSTRGIDRMTVKKDNWTKDNFSDLFYAERNEAGQFENPIPLIGEINGSYHDGVATFNGAGSLMIFTRNNNDGKSKDGLIDLKIYSARQADEYWADITELPFNSDEYTTCHPTLSGDGRRLYFASNRPGGYGGLDIYVCESFGGAWSTPQNLGPTVNSAGNELFPFLSHDETLYYASNGHQGLGGLDIYSAQKIDRQDESTWTIRHNLGKKFNSVKDDFGFWINRKNNQGYFSSSRKDGLGGDDIYAWTLDEGALLAGMGGYSQEMCVFDSGSGQRLSKASVTITEVVAKDGMINKRTKDLVLTLKPLDDKKEAYVLGILDANETIQNSVPLTLVSSEAGEFAHFIQPGKQYRIQVEKKGYAKLDMIKSYQDLQLEEAVCFALEKRTCMSLTGVVKNKKYDKPLPNAKVVFIDLCIGEEKKYTTGADGTFDYCIECGCEYRIDASKSGFDSSTEFISTLQKDCDPSVSTEVTLNLGLRKIVKVEPATAHSKPGPPVNFVPQTRYVPKTTYVPTTTYVPVSDWTPEMLNNHFLGHPNEHFSEGMLLTLKDIYYDFDKYNIRIEASKDLDRVVQLLNTYPSMNISLESHTDSRGTRQYNEVLSTNRAVEAREYILSKGIAADRITAAGFGETRLKNNCDDGVDCSEEKHQNNRRTEIRIIKFDRTDIKIEYEK